MPRERTPEELDEIYDGQMEDALYERCRQFLSTQQQRAIMRTGDPVRELMGFVLAERGRAADARLAASLPLVLYFASAEDREEMVAAIREAKPNLISRPMP